MSPLFRGTRTTLLKIFGASGGGAVEEDSLLDLLVNLDYAYKGRPFVMAAVDDSADLETMDYAYRGTPFVAAFP